MLNDTGILVMAGGTIRMLPFDRALPFNNSDLLVMIDKNHGIRLCNISKEGGDRFDISSMMYGKEDVFGKKEQVDERLKDMCNLFQSRVERFFETGKANYLFFDGEEQKFIKKMLSLPGISCSVEIYNCGWLEEPRRINIEELKGEDATKIIRFLERYKIRAMIKVSDYYSLAKENGGVKRNFAEDFRKKREEMMKSEASLYFKKYSKLSSFKSKEHVNLYFRKLKKKYHPDNFSKEGNEKEEWARDICSQISSDHDAIQKTSWYMNLKEKEEA